MGFINNINFRRWAIANFIILALFGALLRYMGSFTVGALNYIYILHAHSHFAFAGWIFLALAILIGRHLSAKSFSALNRINLLTLICSFGMLVSFSFQGYQFVSIAFSTLFLIATYCFGFLVYKKWLSKPTDLISGMLIKSSVAYLVLSSIGPLALGALKASGNTGVIYHNAIYFYLHFQLNGWMVLAALGLITAILNVKKETQVAIRPWLSIFVLSVLPLFFMFTLWAKPPVWVFVLAFVGAFFSALSWFVILTKLRGSVAKFPLMINMAILAVTLKVLFQLAVFVPFIGDWAFLNRNLVIGYVHLISLGIVSPVLIWRFAKLMGAEGLKQLNLFYFVLTVLYLAALFLQPLLHSGGITIAYFQYYLLLVSVLYCIWGLFYYKKLFSKGALLSQGADYSDPFSVISYCSLPKRKKCSA